MEEILDKDYFIDEEILSAFHPRHRGKVETLLAAISSVIAYTPEGTLVVHREPLEGSNIVDLVHYELYNRQPPWMRGAVSSLINCHLELSAFRARHYRPTKRLARDMLTPMVITQTIKKEPMMNARRDLTPARVTAIMTFKEQLRESASAFGRRRAAEARQVRDHLTCTLKILLEEEEQDAGAFREDIKNCKDELLGLLEERYKGAQVRSRVEGLEGEIQPSKIFRTHERRRVKENALREVRGEGGVATSQEEIAAMFEEAYGKLFREEELDEDAFVSVLRGSPTVPDETTDVMNCPIRPSEVQQAIKKLSRNKAPGPDGIGAEFYKMFSDELSPILAEAFNDIESRGLLPPSMRESFTVLIPKKTKKGPIAETTDFRPISLLCCDYKILAKILARRLDIGLRKIIGPHQSYGIRGRSIARNLHVMRTVCEATAEGHQPLAVMQLDLRQAFDRVSHKFLLAALDHFGVGERLREWIALCYREIGTRLLINGVCNTVTYPAVFYKAQAVCCPGVTAKKIHRSWATFVWRSPWERTRRDNLFLHQESGGLGLVNIVIKLNVQRFLLFRDAKEPTLLSALHHLGFPYLGRWMVSTSGRTAKAAALRFYSEIAEAIQFFLALFSWDYLTTITKRKLYWDTVAATFPPPLYRPPPVPDGAARLFRFVRRLPAPTATKDFFVRMHMEVLPVKSWLHGKGVFVPWSLNCDLCGNTETIQHVLVECSNAYLFWDEMRTCFRLSDHGREGIVLIFADITDIAYDFFMGPTVTTLAGHRDGQRSEVRAGFVSDAVVADMPWCSVRAAHGHLKRPCCSRS
ncbi:hypothetical protein ISCGN_026554 [Ixodes scapularis]